MDMTVDCNRPAKRSVHRLQFPIARLRHGTTPRTVGTGMHQRDRPWHLYPWKLAQPCQPLFSQRFAARGCHLFDNGPKRLQLRDSRGKFRQRFRPRQHFVSIAQHPLPAKIANSINDLPWTRPSVRQIPAMQNQIRRALPQIRQHSLERRPVAMNIGYDRDAHQTSLRPRRSQYHHTAFDYPAHSSENKARHFSRIPVPGLPDMWACGAAGSALPWHGRGRRFDPDQVHQISQCFRSYCHFDPEILICDAYLCY